MTIRSTSRISKTLILFFAAWGLLNLVQAFLTPLNNDEAYYWMYSRDLAWGYFDHPPIIALMIKTGYLIFHNELGVRLMTVFAQIAALMIVWVITDREQRQKKENILFFIILIVIFPVFNIYGFIATPDSPLILFTAVFFMAYKRFVNDETWQNILFLGFSMAALVYSKYHGGLLIILVILSNLRLLKDPKFYLASILALFLFVPHLIWQYSNGFPSMKYHLIDRVSGFEFGHVPEYILNQLFIHNLFIMPVCIWLMVKNRYSNKFEKALYFGFTGFLIFFFFASFRYHIQPQWTALISIPMLIVMFNKLDYNSGSARYIKWVAIFFFPLLLFLRIAFMIDFLPVSYLKKEYHNTKRWADEISSLAGDRPVIFSNSYQDPSEYTFYTGKFAHSLNNLMYRKTQYDLWDFEEKVHGKEVLYVPHYITDFHKEYFEKHVFQNGDTAFVNVFKDFQSLQRECVILKDEQYAFKKNETNTIHLQIYNPYPYSINLKHKEFPVVFQIAFIKNGYMELKKNLELPAHISILNRGDTIVIDCSFTLEELPPGLYKLAICSETGVLFDTFNSMFKEAVINE